MTNYTGQMATKASYANRAESSYRFADMSASYKPRQNVFDTQPVVNSVRSIAPSIASPQASAPKKRETYIKPPRIVLSIREKIAMLVILVLICACLLATVGVHAYCAGLQRDINLINVKMAEVQEDIDKMSTEIEIGRNIGTIEESANNKLKMVYPKGESRRHLDVKGINKKKSVADYIRGKVYG